MKSGMWIYFSSDCKNQLWILLLYDVDNTTKIWVRFQEKHGH